MTCRRETATTAAILDFIEEGLDGGDEIADLARWSRDADGMAEMRELPLTGPGAQPPYHLIRHPAARVTVGSIAPGFMYDWHVANQPNILIPIFGTLVVELRDGSRYEFGHGDVLFAEDCVGSGHRSGAGPDGQFGVSVQLDKSLCPAPGESNLDRLLPA